MGNKKKFLKKIKERENKNLEGINDSIKNARKKSRGKKETIKT